MVKLGYLYANGGEIYGKKLLSEDWIRIDQENGFAFQKTGVDGILGKGGMLGQYLMYSPEKKFACAWHTYTTDNRLNGLVALSKEVMENQ